jgi:hypothetical protein
MTTSRTPRRRLPADVIEILAWACRHFDGVGAGRYGEGTLEQLAARAVAPISIQGIQMWLDQTAYRDGTIAAALEVAGVTESVHTEAVSTINLRTNRRTRDLGARVPFEDWRAHLRITQASSSRRDLVAQLGYQVAVNQLRAGQPPLNPLGLWDMGRALAAGEAAESFVARLTALHVETARPIAEQLSLAADAAALPAPARTVEPAPVPMTVAAPVPPTDLMVALRESLERETRERIENTLLMGLVGSWDGYAQQPLKDVPTTILQDAHAWFTGKVGEPVGDRPSEHLLHGRMTRQLAMIDAMLAARTTPAVVETPPVPEPARAPRESFEGIHRRIVRAVERSGVGFQVACAAIRWQEPG